MLHQKFAPATLSRLFCGITAQLVGNVFIVFLLGGSLVAEAGLIRGGGRSGNSIISSSAFAGTKPFLVRDPSTTDNSEPAGEFGTPFAQSGALGSAAAYGFGPSGFPIAVSHDWGRACAQNTECFFELGASEVFNWQGHVIGLAPELTGGATYDGVADLIITWELLAAQELPPGITSTAPPTTRTLGPDYVWSSVFSGQAGGSYAPGVGSAAVTLGDSLGYLPASDEFSGCFAAFPAGPPVLPLAEAYSQGDCRAIGLDLAAESPALTGADLRSQLLPNEYLTLIVSAELVAPDDYQFANLFAAGGPLGIEALLPGAAGLPTAESIRALDSVEYRGCVALPGSDCDRFLTSSFLMRINVVDDPSAVPAPATLWLFLAGVVAITRRRPSRALKLSGVAGFTS